MHDAVDGDAPNDVDAATGTGAVTIDSARALRALADGLRESNDLVGAAGESRSTISLRTVIYPAAHAYIALSPPTPYLLTPPPILTSSQVRTRNASTRTTERDRSGMKKARPREGVEG
jgi:hypothetical protein